MDEPIEFLRFGFKLNWNCELLTCLVGATHGCCVSPSVVDLLNLEMKNSISTGHLVHSPPRTAPAGLPWALELWLCSTAKFSLSSYFTWYSPWNSLFLLCLLFTTYFIWWKVNPCWNLMSTGVKLPWTLVTLICVWLWPHFIDIALMQIQWALNSLPA